MNILVSGPEHLNFPGEETDSEVLGCDGTGGCDGAGTGLLRPFHSDPESRDGVKAQGREVQPTTAPQMSAALAGEKPTRLSPTALVSEGRAGKAEGRKGVNAEAEGAARAKAKGWGQPCLQEKWEEARLQGAKAAVRGRVASGRGGQGRWPSPVWFQGWEGWDELHKWCFWRLVRLIEQDACLTTGPCFQTTGDI